MAIEIRDFDTAVDDTLDRVCTNTDITNKNPGSVIRTIIESILAENDIQYYQISQLASAMNIDDAIGDDLDRLVAILGVTRKAATQCTGVVTFYKTTESESDIPIEYAQVISTLQDKDGNVIEFIVTDTNAKLIAGQLSVDVNIQAVGAGNIYIPIGTLCIMNTPIIGIESVGNTGVISGGVDAESDDDLRERAKDALSLLGKGTSNSLRTAVLSIIGVSDAIVIDVSRGIGTADIVVVTDVIPPSTALVNEIAQVISNTKSAGIDVDIIYPTIINTNITVTTTGYTNASVIGAAIVNYANTLKISDTFIINQLERYILNACNVDTMDVVTVLPTENVDIGGTEIIRCGIITINGVVYNG